MEIIRDDNRAPYGTACTECNDLLIAPKRSWHAGEQEVYHFWACEKCGHAWLANATGNVAEGNSGRGGHFEISFCQFSCYGVAV